MSFQLDKIPPKLHIELTSQSYQSFNCDQPDSEGLSFRSSSHKSSITEIYSPSDHSLASLYFICLGIASLLPWNTVLSTLDFFDAKFPNQQVTFYFPAALSTTILLIKLLMVWFKDTFSIDVRTAGSLTFQIIFLIAIPILSTFLSGTSSGYWIVMVILITLGAVNQISYASTMGLAGYFPSRYMSNTATGTGLSGVTSNLLRMMLLLLFGDSSVKSWDVIIQYGVTISILGFCIYLHYQFMSSRYARVQIYKHINDVDGLGLDVNKQNSSHVQNIKYSLLKLWEILKEVRTLSIFMILIYIQTLTLYPGVMLKQDIPNLSFSWKVVLLQFVYNTGDTIGKYLAIYRSILTKSFIFKLIICRFVFFFTFIVGAITKDAAIIDDVWFTILNIILFGITNGFTTTALFIFGSESVEGTDKEIVGFALLNCLSFGIMIGTYMAIPFAGL